MTTATTNEFSELDMRRMGRGGVRPLDSPVRDLHIGKPWLEPEGKKIVQHCLIRLDDVERDVIFSVDEEYGKYLCYERADAYLIGLFSLAMRERCNISCEAPVTNELLHQLETELVPALVKYSPQLYTPLIVAEALDYPVPSEGKIATGCSCGIDSLFAIKQLTEGKPQRMKLDYAVINNVGAYSWAGKTSSKRYVENMANAQEFCKTMGLPLIVTDSNFAETFPQDHLQTHLYSSTFAVYMLRKLWGRYYYASTGCDMNDYFGLRRNHLFDSAKYDLLALPSFSVTGLRICNQGAACSRFEKTKALTDYMPARHFLNVCLSQGKGNCGHCSKCKRTMWILDALGKLELFEHVFPIAEYRRNYGRYMQDLYSSHLLNAPMLDETYKLLKSKISLIAKFRVWCDISGQIIKSVLRRLSKSD